MVQTSKPAHLNANDWVTNGVGRKGTGVLGVDQGLPFPQASLAWGCLGRAPLHPWGAKEAGGPGELHSGDGHMSRPPGVALTPFLSTVSHSYGYGLLDAGAMVSLAKNWTTVGPQRKCVIDVLTEPK